MEVLSFGELGIMQGDMSFLSHDSKKNHAMPESMTNLSNTDLTEVTTYAKYFYKKADKIRKDSGYP